MSRRKVTTTVYIEPEQDSMLKALSARTRIPVAEYVRRGIDLVLEQNRDILPGQLGLFDSGSLAAEESDAAVSPPAPPKAPG